MFIYPAPDGRHLHTRRGYAVVDLETTGFDARGRDRIVEIAIVRADDEGRELAVFETLVDPQRPMAAQAIHRITTAMIRDAPTFAEIAPSLLAWLDGVVVVAHNARFEDSFLTAELARAGHDLPVLPALDTLTMAQRCLTLPNHKLGTVCRWAGVRIEGAHTAVGDARATAQMLPALLRTNGESLAWTTAMPALGEWESRRYRPRSNQPQAV